MKIEVVSVGTPETVPSGNGRSYQQLEVIYKKDGKVEGKTIRSFVNPGLFKQVQDLQSGKTVYVETVKNEKGYWEWKSIDDKPNDISAEARPKGKVTGSNYETPDERAKRQVLIVRQSSLSSAIAYSELLPKTKVPSTQEVLDLAAQFEAWVMRNEPEEEVTE